MKTEREIVYCAVKIEYVNTIQFKITLERIILIPDSRFIKYNQIILLVPVAACSKAYVYGRSPVAIVGSNPTRGMDVCLL